MEECTFKPRILEYDGNLQASKITSKSKSRLLGAEKSAELYLKAKPVYEKRDKTKDDFDYEKGQQECTFQPNIGDSQRNMEL